MPTMLEPKYIKESLARIMCHKCGARLEGAELVPVTEAPIALVAHVVCANCQAQSMVTITTAGAGTMPLISDLVGSEIKKFVGLDKITYDEILQFHEDLKGKSIWKLLQKEGKSLAKKQKASGKIQKSQP